MNAWRRIRDPLGVRRCFWAGSTVVECIALLAGEASRRIILFSKLCAPFS